MAMIASTLLNDPSITPITVVDYSVIKNNCHDAYNNKVECLQKGVTVGNYLFPSYSQSVGINCESINISQQNIINNLKSGKLMILNTRSKVFTSGGHFIVLVGVSNDGKILVADPYRSGVESFTIDQVIGGTQALWAFSK